MEEKLKLRRKSTEVRRKEIKESVLDLAYTEGLRKLTTANIAKKIGLSEGAIFKHFKSKQEILLSIVDDVKKELVDNLKNITENKISSEKKFREFICYHLNFLKKNRGVTILLFSEASYENDTKLKLNLYKILNLQKKYMNTIILEGIKNKEFDSEIDVNSFVSIYMGIPISMNIEMQLSKETFNHDEFCKRMLVFLLKFLK